jgi:3-isopropylmalate/(R)-2-methylmalate dehydratase large subunit
VITITGKTIAEKIFSAHSGTDARAGDIVVADVDFVMGQDGTSPLAIRALANMGVEQVFDPAKVALVIDHSSPSPIEGVSALHTMMREFGARTGARVYDIGEGVCHQVVPEHGHVVPGDLMVGCDSHTCTYGAVNVFSTGVGSTDGAAAMASGKLWFKVPDTMKVTYTGELQPGVFSKDLVLYLAGEIGVDGATYEAIEFGGPVIDALSVEARMTISNMAIEVGAKAGLMKADAKTLAWYEGRSERTPAPVEPDADAVYASSLEIDASTVGPQIARPHAVDNVSPIEEVEGTPIAQGVLGTCTNGRLEDFAIATEILRGRRVHPDVRFIVAPASKQIYLDAMAAGYIQALVEAGAVMVTPGCGPCVGTHNGVPSDGENVISTANRNFKRPHGQQQSVHLPRQSGHRGRVRDRGQDHRSAEVLRVSGRSAPSAAEEPRERVMELKANAFKYGDDINTDYIISGKYKFKSADMEAMAVHAMEDLDPHYYEKVKPGVVSSWRARTSGWARAGSRRRWCSSTATRVRCSPRASPASSTETRSTPVCR